MNTSEIIIYKNNEGDITIGRFKSGSSHSKNQIVTTLLVNIFTNIFVKSKICHTFDSNNTCHASHLNSAPGRVFAFYRLLVFKSFNAKSYAL